MHGTSYQYSSRIRLLSAINSCYGTAGRIMLEKPVKQIWVVRGWAWRWNRCGGKRPVLINPLGTDSPAQGALRKREPAGTGEKGPLPGPHSSQVPFGCRRKGCRPSPSVIKCGIGLPLAFLNILSFPRLCPFLSQLCLVQWDFSTI